MNMLQRMLLLLAVAGVVIGVPVTFSHANIAPVWTLALPLGVVFWGLYLITMLLQKEAARFDAEERWKQDAARRTGCTRPPRT